MSEEAANNSVPFLSAFVLLVSWQLHLIRAPQQPIHAHLKAVRDLRQPVDVQRL